MVEIRTIPGTKFIPPADIYEGNIPFQLADRQRVSKKQYHEIPNDDDKQNVVFGEIVLKRYERLAYLNEELHLPKKFIQYEQKSLNKAISVSKKELSRMIKNSRRSDKENYKDELNEFFTQAFNNEDIRKRYIESYHQYLELPQHSKRATKLPEINIQSSTDMINAFTLFEKNIPNDLYRDMIIEHKKRFDEITKEIRPQLQQYYDLPFMLAVRDFSMHHGLDVMYMREKMEELKTRLIIYFNDSKLLGHSRILGFTHGTGQVTLNPFWDEETIKSSFAHELAHNLAGHSYRVRIDDMATDVDLEGKLHTFYAVVPEKSGIVLYNNLRWLNEGLTDLIGQEICPVKDPVGGYPEEISLIQKIIETGKNQISMDLAYQSYFEEHNPKLSEDKQFPKTKEFLKAVSKSWSPGFLIRLDKLISSYGRYSNYAVEEINKHFSEVSEILVRNESVDVVIPEAKKILADGMKEHAVLKKLMDAIFR